MQTYQIRRNTDGNMLYFDAKELLDLCLDNNILTGKKGEYVLVYHKASTENPKQFPEGWYKDDYEDSIQSIMRDDTAVCLFLRELDKRNIIFKPSLDISLLTQTDN